MASKKILLAGVCLAIIAGCSPGADDRNRNEQEAAVTAQRPGEPEGIGSALPPALMFATQPTASVDARVTEPQRAALTELVSEAVRTINSPQFAAHANGLQGYDRIWFGGDTGPNYQSWQTARDRILSPVSPAGFAPASVWIDNAVGLGKTGAYSGGPTPLRIRIGPDVLTRWQSTNVIERSCAINTVAHELSHTLSRQEDRYLPIFLDTPVEPSKGTYASYVMGNLAQCAYLVRQSRIADGTVADCVAHFGVTSGMAVGSCTTYDPPRP